MALTLFLRRKNNTTGKFEYLFLPSDTQTVSFGVNAIAPALPGNSSATITGSSLDNNPALPAANISPNLQFDLGISQLKLKLGGILLAVPSARFPQFVNAAEVYITPGTVPGVQPTTLTALTSVPAQTSTSPTPVAVTGKDMRNLLTSYIADQGNGNSTDYRGFTMGMYNWGGPDDVLPAGWLDNDPPAGVASGLPMSGSYRLWNGLINSLNLTEVAGEPDQFVYSMDFVVGAP